MSGRKIIPKKKTSLVDLVDAGLVIEDQKPADDGQRTRSSSFSMIRSRRPRAFSHPTVLMTHKEANSDSGLF